MFSCSHPSALSEFLRNMLPPGITTEINFTQLINVMLLKVKCLNTEVQFNFY